MSKLMAQRDSLKGVRTELSANLAAIEAKILEADSSTAVSLANVTTFTLKPQRFEHYFTVQGVVETDQNAQVFPQAAAKITAIHVKEGDRVSKGQLLMSLDAAVVSNQIDEVKSRLQLAETVFKKQEKLWDQKIGSEIQYLEAKNNFESLKQNLEALQSQQALYTVVSPFEGVVDEIMPKVGEMAGPQFPAFRIINTENMYMKADVTERYLGQINERDSVKVYFPGIDVTQYTDIHRIGQFINPNNRTFKIRLNLKNEKNKLKPNLLGELSIRDYVSDSAVVIPSTLVQMTPAGQEFVYVLNGGVAQKVEITTGLSYDGRSEVLSGLSGNEQLIDKGSRSIKDGELVNVLN